MATSTCADSMRFDGWAAALLVGDGDDVVEGGIPLDGEGGAGGGGRGTSTFAGFGDGGFSWGTPWAALAGLEMLQDSAMAASAMDVLMSPPHRIGPATSLSIW
jgi:hypothetical protein